jgi:site-specific DNA recombinase
MKRAIIYCRTATAQGDSIFSLDAQIYICRAYCERHDYEVIEVITDDGKSGRTLNRPGLVRVYELITAGKADAVVVTSLGRLTRQADHWLMLQEKLSQAGGTVLIVNEEGTSEATAQVIRGIFELYADGMNIHEITRRLSRRARA